jgi:hypothetical protein
VDPERKGILNDLTINNRFNELAIAADRIAKSSIIPSAFRGKPADVFVALEWGQELGLQPMAALQNIYVVNGRPTLSSQSMAGLVKCRADYMGMELEASPVKAICTIKRKLQSGATETHTGEFTIEKARGAGLSEKDNWKQYPQQMLEARAVAFALRKAYPDILMGVYTKEEMEDVTPFRDITTDPDTSVKFGPIEPDYTPPPAVAELDEVMLETILQAAIQEGLITAESADLTLENSKKHPAEKLPIYINQVEKNLEALREGRQ